MQQRRYHAASYRWHELFQEYAGYGIESETIIAEYAHRHLFLRENWQTQWFASDFNKLKCCDIDYFADWRRIKLMLTPGSLKYWRYHDFTSYGDVFFPRQ